MPRNSFWYPTDGKQRASQNSFGHGDDKKNPCIWQESKDVYSIHSQLIYWLSYHSLCSNQILVSFADEIA
jgi:hypothetical protein